MSKMSNTLASEAHRVRGNWCVRRVDGASVGKEMIVAGRTLVSEESLR